MSNFGGIHDDSVGWWWFQADYAITTLTPTSSGGNPPSQYTPVDGPSKRQQGRPAALDPLTRCTSAPINAELAFRTLGGRQRGLSPTLRLTPQNIRVDSLKRGGAQQGLARAFRYRKPLGDPTEI